MKKIAKIIILALALILVFGSVSAFAYDAYDTYTYSIDGLAMKSPAAYSASHTMTSYDMNIVQDKFGNVSLKDANDMYADADGNIYIADTGNNRIVVLNKYYSAVATITSYVDNFGRQQTLSAPEGVFVTKEDKNTGLPSEIYVCDTGNARVVVFDRSYNYIRTIECPKSPLISADEFVPSSIAVDKYGRIFIVSLKAYQGVIVLSSDGDFTGFIGAQKATYSVIQMIWRRFQTAEQRAAQVQNLSVSYNNLTVDSDGFVYATSDKINESKQLAAIKSKSPDYSPVKKLNSMGNQIMKRNGFFDPGGEVDVFYPEDVSKINDVALGPEGSWTILDYRHSKFFTYDQNGNLLFAFGKVGDQLGTGTLGGLKAITYQYIDKDKDGEYDEYYLLALDKGGASGYRVTVYSPTEYCDTIISALRNENSHLYSASIDDWQEVLTRNNNFDLAYIGIGKALYSQGKFDEAQDVLKNAYEVDYASKAFTEARKDVIGKWILPLLVVGILAIWGVLKFLGYAKKVNKATSLKVGRKTYVQELLYVFHLVFHPFDGFWDLKHEKRGSVRAGSTFLALTVVAFFYNSIGKGYLYNPRGTASTIFMAILSVVLPVILWAVSNWCLTTLFDGEGSFKDIYVATCYSLAPLALTLTASTVLTNVLSGSESTIVTLVTGIGLAWSLMLIFFGMLVTHDYSISKNLITMLGTVVAMLIIMFVAILFSSLLVKMVSFVTGLISEISNRLS